jgi:hypothetical protein
VLPDSASSVSVPGAPGTADCPCFDFAADGTLIDPTSRRPVEVNHLCPSNDVPAGGWTFDYTIYTAGSCHGEVLNTPENNFVCYDTRDLLLLDHPNQSFNERLAEGDNANHIVCLTRNANKTFDFTSCSIETDETDVALGQERYSCGCTLEEGVCGCGNFTEADLADGCEFDPCTCDIVCGPHRTAALYTEDFSSGTPPTGGLPLSLLSYTGGPPANFEQYVAGADWLPAAGGCNGWIMDGTTPSPTLAQDPGCLANGGITGIGTTQTAWFFQDQMANALGIAQGLPPGANSALSSMTNGGVVQNSPVQFQTIRLSTHGQAGHLYQVSAYFAAVHCRKDRPGNQNWIDPIENIDLLVNGAPVVALSGFNPCDNELPGFAPFIGTFSTPIRVARAVSAPILLSADATLGLRVRNSTTASTGNDVSFDLLQIRDVTP